jgi:type III restriction enzyme
MSEIKTLHQNLIEFFGKRTIDGTEIPQFIESNLNQNFPIRPYQKKALQLLLTYFEEAFDGKPKQNHQLLFHMATGSGKTYIMAAAILYLFNKGYRNFLFFVNSTNIIEKTKGNFLNTASMKYLFNDLISISDKKIDVKQVTNFQSVNADEINIVFSTIQGLHMTLNNPKENGLTYDDFEDTKIVLISDEAHHINADTKKGSSPTQDELLEAISWEGTVEKIFKANSENILLEFTATVDLQDEFLAEKYNPKLIFDYPLKEFRKDGYSKEVKVLQADLPQFERALQAVLLSQYRRKLFELNKKQIKPVLLFKSKKIDDSKKFEQEFNKRIKTLSVKELEELKSRTTEPTLKQMFNFFEENKISLENLIIELKEDFSEDKLISVNSKDESDQKQLAVNTLEESNNPYRAIFAVDKLNEGWDVLNLFDIVRLYDTRDSKSNKAGKTTMSEAQLIGRGARYCPFQLSNEQPTSQRKYDFDIANQMRVCEELYYHSAHNPKYIQELGQALQEIGIVAKTTIQRSLSLKDSFKLNSLYKAGHIFLNSRIKYNREDIDALDGSLIRQRHKVELVTGYSRTSTVFEGEREPVTGIEKKSKDYTLLDFGTQIVNKAIQKIDFYRFDNLQKYLPKLDSIASFIASPKYLGGIQLEVVGLADEVNNLTADQKLSITTDVLTKISSIISSDKIEYKGTKEFFPQMIKSVFTDKILNFSVGEGEDRQSSKSMNDLLEATNAYHLDLTARDWFAYNDCYGTSEEKLLIKYIDKKYDDLKHRYSDVYLLRNERHFQLYNFEDGRPLEPDFVLFLIGKESSDTLHYQVFIEPKGGHLLKADEWKEKFLMEIHSQFRIEQLFENKKYSVWGMPFFNSEGRMNEFESSFKELLD